MAQQIINVGSAPNDGTGDVLRNSQIKANANFTELYTNKAESSEVLSNDETTYTAATLPLAGTEVAVLNDGTNWVKITWNNIKSQLKTYFDTIYQAILVSGTNIKTINGSSVLGSGNLVVNTGTKEIYAMYPSWNLTVLNTWRTWNRNTSNILVLDATQNAGTGRIPTIIGNTAYADSNYMLIKDWSSLSKMVMTVREQVVSGITVEIFLKSFDLVNGIGRGNESNGQVLINEVVSLGNVGNAFIKDNFTIAVHTLSPNTIFYFFYRITSGSTATIQGVHIKFIGN